MKLSIALTSVVLVTACAGVPDRGVGQAGFGGPTAEQRALQSAVSTDLAVASINEHLRLEFDAAGNWARIVTVGTAELVGTEAESAAALETAYQAATLRAKRSLAEFLSTDVRSRKTLRRISRSAVSASEGKTEPTDDSFEVEGDDHDQSPRQQAANRVATTVSERISAQSAAILKGAHVTRRGRQEGVALVELVASRVSIDAAREITRRMVGSL